MTTTIAPSVGGGALFTQQGRGTSPGFDALDLRRAKSTGQIQEGVYAAGDYMVTQRGAGANMSVDIAASSGATAEVQGDTITGQGLYTVGPHSATINEAITTADATNPRVDQVILEVQDNVHDASGGNLARTRVLTGTPTGGATLTNRTGAAALPGNALLLADVLVGAGVSTIPNSVIRDRRKWARGAYWLNTRTGAGPDYSVTATSKTLIDSTNFQPRVECSGAPIKVRVQGEHTTPATIYTFIYDVFVDGAVVVNGNERGSVNPAAAAGTWGFNWEWQFTPAAGSHLIGPTAHNNTAATTVIKATTAAAFVVTIEEIVRQNTANNTTTTG